MKNKFIFLKLYLAVEKSKVLQSLIRIGGHKYSQISSRVEELKKDLSDHIDKQHKLSLLLRGQNAVRYIKPV